MSEETYTKNDFDLDVNKRFEKKIEIFRIIGLVIIFSGIASGLSGLLGYGWWTKEKVQLNSGSIVEYEKFLHAKKETELKVQYRGDKKDSFVVEIGSPYFKKINIQKITPEPYSTITGSHSIKFYFKGQHNKGLVLFNTIGHNPGKMEVAIKINKDSALIHQFIYP